MPYRYKLGIEAMGRGYREVDGYVADNDAALHRVCNALLEGGTKVTILERRKVAGKRKESKPRLTR